MIKYAPKWIYITILILIVWAIGRTSQKHFESLYYGSRNPFIQMLSHNQATIIWQTENMTSGTILYGTNKKTLNTETYANAYQHSVTLKKLKPNTLYWYRISDEFDTFSNTDNKKDDFSSFKTAPIDRNDSIFWVLGDPGKPGKAIKNVKKSAYTWLEKNIPNKNNFDLILTTGDNAYKSGKNIEFQKSMFDIYGDKLSSTNIWPSLGNHDARRWAFYRIFTFPTQGELGGVPSKTEEYFSFDYDNVHFIYLNSEYNTLIRFNNMEKWLEEDLINNKKTWTVVLFHTPPYTKGSHDSDSWWDSRGRMIYMREKIVPLLENYGVDLVLSGHSHAYERSHLLRCHYGYSSTFKEKMVIDDDFNYEKPFGKSPLTGTIYTIVGSSSKLNKGIFNHPAMPINHSKIGSMIMSVKENELTGRFIDQHGVELDKFTINKTNDLESELIYNCNKFN